MTKLMANLELLKLLQSMSQYVLAGAKSVNNCVFYEVIIAWHRIPEVKMKFILFLVFSSFYAVSGQPGITGSSGK